MQNKNLSVILSSTDLTACPREMVKSHKFPISNFQGPFEDCNFKRDY